MLSRYGLMTSVTATAAPSASTVKRPAPGRASGSSASPNSSTTASPDSVTNLDPLPRRRGGVTSAGGMAIFTVTSSPADQDWPVLVHWNALLPEVLPSPNVSVLVVLPFVTSK